MPEVRTRVSEDVTGAAAYVGKIRKIPATDVYGNILQNVLDVFGITGFRIIGDKTGEPKELAKRLMDALTIKLDK